MFKFEYKVVNSAGKTEKGLVEARNSRQAAQILHNKNYVVVTLSPQKLGPFTSLRLNFQKVGSNDVVNFTRQFSTMITAGLPLTQALSLIEDQATGPFRKVISEVLKEVEEGGSLFESMAKQKNVFSSVYLALIRAGEVSGSLDKVLNRLADTLEKQREFRAKVKGAMVYPAIVVVGMIIVSIIMMVVVVPKMTSMYADFGTELPMPTRLLMAISDTMSRFWWSLPLVALAGIFTFKTLMKNERTGFLVDQWLFRLPIFGRLREQTVVSEFSRTLGLLASTGILLVEALETVKGTMNSLVFQKAVAQIIDDVQKGLPLAASLARTEVFPPVVIQMVSIGEETGKIDEVLNRAANYFEQQADYSVKNLTTAIEPIIMVVLGLGVAFLMISMILPMYSLTSQF
ncbi:MAG: type II secretion system F family protein [Candidatus Shapirobacteria bacterium]